MINILKTPIKMILRGFLVRYWKWRIARNNAMLDQLQDLRECFKNNPEATKKDCDKVQSLINSLQHATSGASLELFKAMGVEGII